MVLTEEVQKDIYPIASLENTEAVNLEKAFYNIDGVNIVDKSAAMQIPDYANNNGIPTNNSQVTETNMSQRLYRLNGNVQGSKMGLGITLKVMAGDQVDIMAKSYWKTADGNVSGTPSAIDLEGLLTNFVGNGIANKQGITGPLLNSAGGITSMLNELLNGQSQTSTRPKAYLNWILFDENFRPVTGSGHTNSGFDAVGASGVLKPHNKSTGEIIKNGYLYIYCSNESRLDVFFDNLQVIHTRGALLEETHYYPFGLTMAGISSKAAGKLENKDQKFQGQKFDDDLGLNWYQFKWRNHDPQIGRFIEIDPLSNDYVYNSTFAFSENKVTGHIELEGLEAVDVRYYVEKGIRQTSPEASEQDIKRIMEAYDNGSAKGAIMGLKVAKTVGIGILVVTQPEIGVPLALSDLTGIPVTPSPQAMAGPLTSASTSLKAGAAVEDELVTLYRGVNSSKIPYDDAVQGLVKPRGGNATPAQHNAGNTNSNFTSWTFDKDVATNFALRPNGSGVVLETSVSKSSIVASPSTKNVSLIQKQGTVVNEREALLRGDIKIPGSNITLVKTFK